MGGYAFYVWTSYALVSGLLLYHFFAPIVRHKNLKQQLREQLSEED